MTNIVASRNGKHQKTDAEVKSFREKIEHIDIDSMAWRERRYKPRNLAYYNKDGSFNRKKYVEMNSEKFMFRCEVCEKTLSSISSRAEHLRSKNHKQNEIIYNLKKQIEHLEHK